MLRGYADRVVPLFLWRPDVHHAILGVRYTNLNKTQDIESLDDVELCDVVVAIFQAADAIWDELRAIRVALTSKRYVCAA
jgi:hypothetical protein